MIYAGSPALDGLRYVVLDEVHYLQDAYRGPVWEEVIIHLPARGRPGVPVGHGVERRGAGRLDPHRPRPDRGGHRGAPAGRARATSTWSATAAPSDLHLLPTFVPRPTATPAQPRGGAPRRQRNARGAGRARPAAAAASTHPGRVEVGRAARRARAMLPAIYFIFSRGRVRRRRRAVPRRRAPADHARASASASAAIAEAEHRRPGRRRPRVLGYDQWLAGLEAGIAAHHAGHGAAVQGGGRGVLRRRAGEGGVRHRDAVARHQHAGPVGRDREADQVHRRAPRVPDAGGVHPAHRAGRAARHRRRRLRHRAVDPVRALRPGGRRWRRSRTLRPHARRSGRPTTWPPTWCGATRRDEAHHLLNLSFAQYQADRDVVRAGGSSSAPATSSRASAPRPRRRPRRHRGVPGRSAPRWTVAPATAARPGASTRRWRPLRPGDVVVVRRKGGRVAVPRATRTGGAGGSRLVAVTPGRDVVRLGPQDFDDPAPPRSRTIELPTPFAPRNPTFRRQAADAPAQGRAPRRPQRPLPPRRAPARRARDRARPRTRWPTIPERRAHCGRPAPAERFDRDAAAHRAPRAGPQREPGPPVRPRAARPRGVGLRRRLVAHRRRRAAGPPLPRVRPARRRGAARGAARRPRPRRARGLVSCFTYEHRGPDGQDAMPPARWPTKAVAKRCRAPSSGSPRSCSGNEDDAGLPETRLPDPGFTPLRLRLGGR